MKTTILKNLGALLALGVVACGCDVGNAPAGESPESIKARMDKLSLEDHAKEIKKLSQPGWVKKQSIERLYKDAGKPVPPEIIADLGSDNGPAGVAGAPGK